MGAGGGIGYDRKIDPRQGFKLFDGKTIELEEALGTDHTATGIIIDGQAGENLVFGDCAYLKSDGKRYKADADSEDTLGELAMVLETINTDATGKLLKYGYIRDDSWSFGTKGADIYVSATAGAVTDTIPAIGTWLQKAGYAQTATIMLFDPAATSIFQDLGNIIGVEWNKNTDTWTRIDLHGAPYLGPTFDFDAHSPWQDIVRCTLNVDGSENEVSANGKGDDISLDGSTGRVMVRIPKFYVNADNSITNVYRWWISPAAYTGFEVHPAFVQRGGTERDYIYVGAYESGDDGANKLESETGDVITVSQTISTFRTWAENINAGDTRWGIMSMWPLSAVRLLYYIEYANANSQTTIGRGVVDVGAKVNTGAGGIDANLATNGTGTGTGTSGATPIAYRGIENFWGNTWQFIDGYEAHDAPNKYRIIKRDGSGTFRNPFQAGDYETSVATPITMDGYQSNIIYEDLLKYLLIPNAVAGSTTSNLCNYFYAHDAAEVNILLFGGDWDDADKAGVASLDSHYVASVVGTAMGARLEFV